MIIASRPDKGFQMTLWLGCTFYNFSAQEGDIAQEGERAESGNEFTNKTLLIFPTGFPHCKSSLATFGTN